MTHDQNKDKSSKKDNSPKEPKTYYIRMAQPEDFDKVFDFYTNNDHPSLKKREMQELKERAAHGSIVLIEDEDKNIVAASVCFAYKKKHADGTESVEWTEAGASRISGLNGFPGVFDTMVAAQVLRNYMVEPPEHSFVARMRYEAVQKTAERLGWRKMDDLGDFDEFLEDDRKNDWYRLGVEGLPIMAKYMVEAWNKPVITNKKTGEQIRISFERSTMFEKFKDSIEKLAERDYGSVDKPDLTKGIRKHRDEWLVRRFR